MFQTIKNAWKVADLKKKLLFTMFILLIYRVGNALPVPFVNAATLSSYMSANSGSIFDYLNLLSGGAFANATLFALNVSPYITASIILQLLCVAIPYLERLQKEGEEGRKKINRYTRYTTVVLALISAFGYYQMLKSYNARGFAALADTGPFAMIIIIACFCAGSALVMWLAEKINESGIGNGISLILFANIISRVPAIVSSAINFIRGGGKFVKSDGGTWNIPMWLGIIIVVVGLAVAVAMIAFIVWMTNSERRLPVQYAKKVVGRKMYGGQSSNLPIKVNMTGVMPIIFANSILTLPQTIKMFTGEPKSRFWQGFLNLFDSNNWFYAVLTLVLLIAFAYFYTAISFDPTEVSNNIKTQGGFIPGIRPGRPTADYIKKVLSKVTFIGAICLAVVAVLPIIINILSNNTFKSLVFGGSSIIIVVGVILETIREIEAQLTMRHYKGFLE